MILHFVLGVAGSYIGGIPFGPLNLAAVDTTLRFDRRSASRFAIGASIVEIIEVGLAILFGEMISLQLNSSLAIKILVIAFFVLFGFYFILKRDTPELEEQRKSSSHFIRGLIISSLNPQALPYWIFVLAFFDSYELVDLQGERLIVFLTGVSIGKYLILGTFGLLSEYLKKHLQEACRLISRTIGIILIGIGILEAIRFFS